MNKIKNMNILGDSITYGTSPYNDEKLENTYVSFLKEMMQLENVKNYGINGSTISDNSGYEPMCIRYEKMDNNSDIIIVFGGTNDFDYTEAELGNLDSSDKSTVYGALKILINGLKIEFPGALILFITPLPRDSREKDRVNKRGYKLKDIAKAIVEVCELNNIYVFDLYNNCTELEEVEVFKKYIPDGIHPTEEYHKILANKIYNFIKNMGGIL